MKEFLYTKGKRKYIFCADSKGAELLYNFVQQAMEDKVPFDFMIIGDKSDAFLEHWYSQQKMGTFLYLSGQWEFIKRLKKLALEAGFSEYEMQINIVGQISKKLVCCECYGVNEFIDDDLHLTCKHCGIVLEVSSHYSRRLEAYLGYTSIS
ncbi:dimethylamine monooxygenase subunit DmmA family protein [Neobacillus terrae]|uniref:dimethylamine monooxygenase subunit DmmA family protein n=1 Tax=Neobacillus terrae TaxID=3034837 RepID=UPI001408DD41|nr:dimethylamine monooxygenase subunit DmmA family protein [Neobacillus terrae]NHM32278.1 hypothetical protein [Neobacillus terrae]